MTSADKEDAWIVTTNKLFLFAELQRLIDYSLVAKD